MAWKCILIAFFLVSIILVYAESSAEKNEQEFVDLINEKQSSWTAVKRDVTELRNMIKKQSASTDIHMRALQDPSVRATVVTAKNRDIPEYYDSSEEYPQCNIRKIKYQYQCGCCWAVSSSAVMQNRLCIASGGNINVEISAAYLVACCDSCADGCNFGTTIYSWVFMLKHGVVTGGNYGSNKGCYPFPLCPTCPAPNNGFACPTTTCPNYNNDIFTVENDKHYVSDFYVIEGDAEAMKEELFENGPICTTMKIYEDFLYYQSGIYQHVSGKSLGGHNLRLIGYGSEDGIDYWIGVNSWPKWGEDGSFRIRRGVNEVDIEKLATAGLPILSNLYKK